MKSFALWGIMLVLAVVLGCDRSPTAKKERPEWAGEERADEWFARDKTRQRQPLSAREVQREDDAEDAEEDRPARPDDEELADERSDDEGPRRGERVYQASRLTPSPAEPVDPEDQQEEVEE